MTIWPVDSTRPGRLALLRAAYPDGYLAIRGVVTIGGWLCERERGPRIYLSPSHVSYGFPFCSDAAVACAEGALLPDLTDRLTFQAALIDLAEALGEDDARELPGLTWWFNTCATQLPTTWILDSGPAIIRCFENIAEKGEIDSLLRARALIGRRNDQD